MDSSSTDLYLEFHATVPPIEHTNMTILAPTQQQCPVCSFSLLFGLIFCRVDLFGGYSTLHTSPSVALNIGRNDIFINKQVVAGLCK